MERSEKTFIQFKALQYDKANSGNNHYNLINQNCIHAQH